MSEDSIDIRVYIQAIRRWWWLLLLGPVLAGALAVGISLRLSEAPAASETVATPKIYEASTILGMAGSGILGMEGSGMLGGAPELITTRPILQDVINDLGLSITVAELRPAVLAERIPGSSLIQLTVVNSDPDLAVNIADAVAQSLINHIIASQEPQRAAVQEDLAQKLTALEGVAPDSVVAIVIGNLSAIAKQPVVVTPAEIVDEQQKALASGSNTMRNFVLGIFLGGVLSALLVFLLEYFKNPVRSPDQFESKFGFTRMGTLPKSPKRRNQSRALLVADESTPSAMETVRQLATSVTFTIEERHIDTVAIASPETRDGRSSLTANLGVALAGGWKDVVIVDADLRCPTLHNFFNADNTTGLSDFLANPDLELGQIMQETRYNRLRFIPSGPVSTNPVELLSSPRMRWLLEHLKETTDVVLLDTPPLLAVTDGVVVCNQVGGVILLVNGPNNGIDNMKDAVVNLERAGTPILGYVWNAMTSGLSGKSPQSRQYYRRFTNRSWQDTRLGSEAVDTGVGSYSNGASVGVAPST